MGYNNFSKKQILPQMFDVRPTDKDGNLDLEKIEKAERIMRISKDKNNVSSFPQIPEKIIKIEDLRSPNVFDNERDYFVQMMNEERKVSQKKKKRIEVGADGVENIKNIAVEFGDSNDDNLSEDSEEEFSTEEYLKKDPALSKKYFKNIDKYFSNIKEEVLFNQIFKKNFFFLGKFALASAFIIVIFLSASSVFKIKNGGMVKGESAIAEMASAKDDIKNGNFDQSYIKFKNANEKLSQISNDLGILGGSLGNFTRYIPFLSKISSGSNIIKASEKFGEAGKLISEVLQNIDNIKNNQNQSDNLSYLKLFQDNVEKLKKISSLLEEAQDSLDKVNLDDIPSQNRSEFIQIKGQLLIINNLLVKFLDQERIFVDILGGNGPRKYLFLFQNNQEMRATGGFIGSYGLLDIFNGKIRNFFIDGIFNPDGQLKEKIVPPLPIQKISAAWSLHDSNWFPDFPVSAEKACYFYEKTGGPTVDGVIAITPTVMQKLLEITGPIEMSNYGVTVDENNFIEEIQREVEIDYDKELNQPKKILSDLAPKVLDRIFNSKNFADFSKTANILLESLNQKQILIYSKNWEIEKMLSQNTWAGKILDTSGDYLSVINTNINGYKTDGVIDENITHETEISPDGTIVDNVTIVRHHNGGDTPYDWWNKVNADYLRVYVPKGSRLISVEGQTREFNSSPLDYDTLGFKRDPQVQMEEDLMEIDKESGTRIYNDADKTVFANWIYVSPKETVTIKYSYVLPFKVDLSSTSMTNSYSLLVQKQSGSLGSGFSSKINYPASYKLSWQYPENELLQKEKTLNGQREIEMKTNLVTDKFIGLSFSKN